jgi:integrase
MARPKKSEAPDLSQAIDLTAGAIERLTCPAGKQQVFMRDTKAPGLRVRATPVNAKHPAGFKSFVFEKKLDRQTIRRTIGDVRAWTIEAARIEAARLAVMFNSGTDPRELERQHDTAKAEKKAADIAHAVTVGEAWSAYLDARKPYWGERHYRDHVALTKAGGLAAVRGTRGRGVTIAAPIHSLVDLTLRDLTAPVIEAWAAREGKARPTSARLAWRCLKAFLGWCAEQPEYSPVLPAVNPAKTKKTREALGKAKVKQDALLREQLTAWFAAVRQIHNPVIAAYLQTLLLTGARPGEVLALRWADVTDWNGLTIRDKVEGTRIIPKTPYVAQLLATLPKRNEWVFSSATADAGVLTIPRTPHNAACAVAGIDGLTLHGLRRSFKSLTEWLEIPAGVVAQLMGHKPSATAEKHYTVRPLDLLRVHHEKIEAWILEQAGVQFVADVEPGKLRAVAGGVA